MRKELELLDLVDRYLDGGLNEAERAAFEQRLLENADLRAMLEDQRVLREGVARVALRPAVTKAYRAHRFGKWKPWLGGAGAVVLAVAGATLWTQRTKEVHNELDPPMEVDSMAPTSERADTVILSLPVQHVEVDSVIDTVYRVLRNGRWETTTTRPGGAQVVADSTEASSAPAPGRTEVRTGRTPLPVRMEPVETKPEFPGGMSAFYDFLEASIRHPDLEKPVSGTVEVGFTINAEGRVEDVEVVKGLNAAYNAEAIRVIRSMPRWKPGMQDGKPVPSRLQMPMEFRNPGATGAEIRME
jgi:TonB family protein